MIFSFVLYIGWIVFKFGVQPSISDSFYALQDKYGKGSLKPWLFWLFLINVAWPLFPLLKFNGFSFFALAGLILVGAAARFKQGKHVEIPHIIGATGGIALAFVAIGFVFGGWAWIWLGIGLVVYGLLSWTNVPNNTWWTQIIEFVLIVIALFVHS
jgi:hypothetical protein